MSIERQRIFWLVLFVIMILAAFILPFTSLFTNLAKFQGAFCSGLFLLL